MRETGKFVHFDDVPSSYGIALAKDGTAWFAEFSSKGKIGKVDPDTGKVTKYAVPTPDAWPRRIQVADDGTIWFAEFGESPATLTQTGKIAHFDPKTETFKEYTLPGKSASPYAFDIDAKGRMCYSNMHEDVVGCLDPKTEHVVEYPMPFSENTMREFFRDRRGACGGRRPQTTKSATSTSPTRRLASALTFSPRARPPFFAVGLEGSAFSCGVPTLVLLKGGSVHPMPHSSLSLIGNVPSFPSRRFAVACCRGCGLGTFVRRLLARFAWIFRKFSKIVILAGLLRDGRGFGRRPFRLRWRRFARLNRRDARIRSQRRLSELLEFFQARQLLEIRQPKPNQKLFRGAIQNRPADHFLASRSGDQVLLEQRLDHAAHIHAANFVDLRHGRWLLVGDHRERLERRHGQPQRRL